ncbi:MAG: anthranilate synthase component I family protein [Gammaproteobacteria bacterium]|nr:anthranilate synthase component I family protein [Gammaproteobacteria bacterium]MCY4338651.1 anthranilate synthase component I family protein [Gammaproteobacteria bacterium]
MKPPFDIAADLDTPVSAFLKLRPLGARFLLESVERGEQVARFSFLGLGSVLDLHLESRTLTHNGSTQSLPAGRAAVLAALRDGLRAAPQLSPQVDEIPFQGGLVGYADFDLIHALEQFPHNTCATGYQPRAAYMAPRSLLVFDHLTRRVALLHAGSEVERLALQKEISAALRGPIPACAARNTCSIAKAALSRNDYMQLVYEAKQKIRDGDIFQVVLANRFYGECDLTPFTAYRALRLINPSPYMYYLEIGDRIIAGSSPEAMVKLQGDTAALRPIAGTRPRGQNAEEDQELEQGLLNDPKEVAEHVMLVDLARNDLGRVAAAGSVQVDPWLSIERYSHVMHIVSGVRGTPRPGQDAFDLFAASFPAGTLVGAPKIRAIELLNGYEPAPRGLYGGTVGYFDHYGNMDQAIAIRTIVFENGGYSYHAGAGIVADSNPATEHDEVLAKSAVMRQALALTTEGF